MPIDKVKRAFTWLRKSLRIIDKTTLPGEILGEVRPTLDVFGWDLIAENPPEQVNNSSAGATLFTRLPPVPEGEVHLFLTCDAEHTDPVGSHILRIDYRDETALAESTIVSVATGTALFDDRVIIRRPILVTPGARLVVISSDSIPIGSVLNIRGHFVRLNLGEYFAGSPYG